MACCSGCAKTAKVNEVLVVKDISKQVSSIEPKGKNATLANLILTTTSGEKVESYFTPSNNKEFCIAFDMDHQPIAIVRRMTAADRWIVESLSSAQRHGILSAEITFAVDGSTEGEGVFKITEYHYRLRDQDATREFIAEHKLHPYKPDPFGNGVAVGQIYDFIKLDASHSGMWPLLVSIRPDDGPHVMPSMYVKIPGWFDNHIWK